jgi:hypothetical protein
MEPGVPKRDTPDNEDFEGESKESEQLPEEAPREVTDSGGRGEKQERRHEKRAGRDERKGER